jgi:hypothetical protein
VNNTFTYIITTNISLSLRKKYFNFPRGREYPVY